ncbi:unnamed protein product [Gadus morhua 'NCC']
MVQLVANSLEVFLRLQRRVTLFQRFNSEYALADTAGAVATLGRHTTLSVVPHPSGSGTTFPQAVNGGGPS